MKDRKESNEERRIPAFVSQQRDFGRGMQESGFRSQNKNKKNANPFGTEELTTKTQRRQVGKT
jgi:hypothetical protein